MADKYLILEVFEGDLSLYTLEEVKERLEEYLPEKEMLLTDVDIISPVKDICGTSFVLVRIEEGGEEDEKDEWSDQTQSGEGIDSTL